jgi:hypothetical protein
VLTTQFISLGTKDFALALSVRANVTYASQTMSFGFEDGGGASGFLIGSTTGGNWTVSYDDLTHTYNTGLAVTSHVYNQWRFLRYGGTQYIYLNGTLLTSFADTYNYSNSQRLVITGVGGGTSPDTYVDYVKFWASR